MNVQTTNAIQGHDLTEWILIGVVVLLAIYDVFALLYWGEYATISYVLRESSYKYPIIAFLLGLLVGHALWP